MKLENILLGAVEGAAIGYIVTNEVAYAVAASLGAALAGLTFEYIDLVRGRDKSNYDG